MIEPAVKPDVRDVARHYDDLDPYYRQLWGHHVHHGLWRRGDESPEEAVRALVELVANAAEIRPDSEVCDVGCGYGATARMLAGAYGARVTGWTVSRAQFELATGRNHGGDNPAYRLQDWLKNDLPAASRDAVVSIECVSHVADKERFYAEIRRVLRPGGRAVVCAWLTREHPRAWETRHLLEPICREGRLPGVASAAEHLELIRSAGFRRVAHDDLSRNVKKTWGICVRRLATRMLRDRELREHVRRESSEARAFAKSVFRIWTGYAVGAIRYGLFRMRP